MQKLASLVTAVCGVGLMVTACASGGATGARTPAASSPTVPAARTATGVSIDPASTHWSTARQHPASGGVTLSLPELAAITASSTSDQTVGMPATSLDPSALPLGGSSQLSTSPKAGSIYLCDGSHGGPSITIPPWVDSAARTWDASTKVAVRGTETYPPAPSRPPPWAPASC